MSTETRTVQVPKQIEVAVCDQCGAEAQEPHKGLPDSWMRITENHRCEGFHFCGVACLAEWAKRQAAKSAALAR